MTGENIWQGQGYDVSDAQKLAELVVEAWMNSPGHRENILRQEYTHLGVGGSQKSAPVKYGIWLSDQGILAAEPVSINQTQVAVGPGNYRLRLYFVASRQRNRISYIIYNGPQLVIK
ncbi:SCP-like extracellular domain protein [Candidatus Thiomargarita nelsonii]|uniref:SCP-like extracellular domain protein n=1 Tax=Candidatus Thiomargarita nelsonii TaxID=1003181 RepID=A0A176S5F1_9GAMM|nr:SCP-like extracellular domain protein [Candidatus Thiomargarita nelsonii]